MQCGQPNHASCDMGDNNHLNGRLYRQEERSDFRLSVPCACLDPLALDRPHAQHGTGPRRRARRTQAPAGARMHFRYARFAARRRIVNKHLWRIRRSRDRSGAHAFSPARALAQVQRDASKLLLSRSKTNRSYRSLYIARITRRPRQFKNKPT